METKRYPYSQANRAWRKGFCYDLVNSYAETMDDEEGKGLRCLRLSEHLRKCHYCQLAQEMANLQAKLAQQLGKEHILYALAGIPLQEKEGGRTLIEEFLKTQQLSPEFQAWWSQVKERKNIFLLPYARDGFEPLDMEDEDDAGCPN